MMVSSADSGRNDSLWELALTRELLLRLPVSVAYVAGPDLVFEFANEEFRQVVGGRDLIGLPMRKALPELPPERVELIEHIGSNGQPLQARESEIRIRRYGEEPERLFVDIVYQAVRDDAGDIAGVLLCANDVTAHVRDQRRLELAADRLAITEERYRTLFETLPLGVVHCKADGTILGANPAASEILGVAPEAMTTWPIDRNGLAVREDGSPLQRDELPVMVALRTGQVVADMVIGMPHGRTGDLRWLQVAAVPDARDEHGRPQRAYAMMTDITKQHRAEAAVREGSRLLGRLRDANVLGVVVANEERVLEANDAYLDIVGYTRADLEAGRISWRALTPTRWAASDDDAIEQLRLTGASRPYEKEYIHRDGHRVPILVGAAVIDWDPLRWATFVVDLSARQRREQEQAALLAREQAARSEADTARQRLAFLQRAGDLAAASLNRDDLLEQVSQLVELTGTPGNEGLVIGTYQGPEAWGTREALRVLNAELEERVNERTSELLRAEAERRALETKLRQAERLETVGQLSSGIAHDFRNLLGVVVGYAEMAEDVSDQLDPELHRILGEIRLAADRAVNLTNDLLNFGRRARTGPDPVDINAMIAGIADLLAVSVSGGGTVGIEPWPTALPPVLADQGQLEQVLLNLTVNARDAMPDGGTVTISTSPADFDAAYPRPHLGLSPGRYVELAVSDTGTGMSADIAARIFERFFTTKPAGKGTGLGLSTVRGIIDEIGGAIEVDTQEGCGTTFHIYLPAVSDSPG
jgi:PAS domain S-box-containing protein